MARALVGAWPVAAGAIRIDGAPIEQWRPEDLGSTVGYLPQDVELFAGTVEENISRFEPSTDPNKVISAAYRANVHEVILDLPQGYMTRLGEGGATLSAGQRQRIGLARALFGDPSFVVSGRAERSSRHRWRGGTRQRIGNIARKRRDGCDHHAPAERHQKCRLSAVARERTAACLRSSVRSPRREECAGTISGTPIAPNNASLVGGSTNAKSRQETFRRHQPARVPSEPAST